MPEDVRPLGAMRGPHAPAAGQRIQSNQPWAVALVLLGWSQTWTMGTRSTNCTGETQITQGKGPRVMPGAQTYGRSSVTTKNTPLATEISVVTLFFLFIVPSPDDHSHVLAIRRIDRIEDLLDLAGLADDAAL
jgi:hypothetical protein